MKLFEFHKAVLLFTSTNRALGQTRGLLAIIILILKKHLAIFEAHVIRGFVDRHKSRLLELLTDEARRSADTKGAGTKGS